MSAWLERLSNSHNLLLNVDVIKNWEGGWLAKPPTTIFAKFYITLTEELFFCFFSFLLVKVFDKPVAPPPPHPPTFNLLLTPLICTLFYDLMSFNLESMVMKIILYNISIFFIYICICISYTFTSFQNQTSNAILILPTNVLNESLYDWS